MSGPEGISNTRLCATHKGEARASSEALTSRRMRLLRTGAAAQGTGTAGFWDVTIMQHTRHAWRKFRGCSYHLSPCHRGRSLPFQLVISVGAPLNMSSRGRSLPFQLVISTGAKRSGEIPAFFAGRSPDHNVYQTQRLSSRPEARSAAVERPAVLHRMPPQA